MYIEFKLLIISQLLRLLFITFALNQSKHTLILYYYFNNMYADYMRSLDIVAIHSI